MKGRLQIAADLLQHGRLAEARSRLLKELRLAPCSLPALELLGAVASEMGKHDEAIGYLRRVVSLAPLSSPGPRLNLGRALCAAGHLDDAADILQPVVSRWPDIFEARLSYGCALLSQEKLGQAVAEFRAAIQLNREHVGARVNLAYSLFMLRDYEQTRLAAERLVELDPNSVAGQFLLAISRQILCAWDGYEARLGKLRELVEQGQAAGGMAHSSLLFWDAPRLHQRFAELEAQSHLKRTTLPPAARHSAGSNARIRVAYVSADFREHPISALIPNLIEEHDRSRFEVIGISVGQDDKSPQRQRLERGFDKFIDMHGRRSDVIVRNMRDMQIDIAVDLMGYTANCRPAIFLQRAAPIQVNYLGYPGTFGTAGVDYMIVDPFIATDELRRWSTETLVILPDCYQCNDGSRPQPSERPTRSSCGLPEDAFVFCSFNHRKKFTPNVFDLWMRILRHAEGSVLWVPAPPGSARSNLCSEAIGRGVDPARIIFADRVDDYSLHLARNALADLHLDTFPYGGHTTASDALWSGCPILTRAGTSFASRVCGSLLTTIGVPELITATAEEYEALAVKLAKDRSMLADLRQRVDRGRASSPLFDTPRFSRNLERAYEAMVARARAGKPPAEIDVRVLP